MHYDNAMLLFEWVNQYTAECFELKLKKKTYLKKDFEKTQISQFIQKVEIINFDCIIHDVQIL